MLEATSLALLKGAALLAPLLLAAAAAAVALRLRKQAPPPPPPAALHASAAGAADSSSSSSSPSSSPFFSSLALPLALALAVLALGGALSSAGLLHLHHRRGAPAAPAAPAAPLRGGSGRAPRPIAPLVYTPKYLNATLTGSNFALDFACVAADGSLATCSPSFCASSSQVSAAASAAACPYPGSSTPVNYASQIARVSARTCAVSSDARCTSAALAATFGRFPQVLAAYCNDKYLVVHGTGEPGGTPNLDDVPFPPGGTIAGSGAACRTRSVTVGTSKTTYQVVKVPLSPQMLPAADPSNNVNSYVFPSGATDAKGGYLTSQLTGLPIGLPIDGAVGFALTTQQLFPMYNNRGGYTPAQCEVDACNQHVGQGGGQPHLHGDPFGSNCLYSKANYTNAATGAFDATVHPPLIGYSFDGFAIHGRHLSTSAVGFGTALDTCGGHVHDNLAYHYHAQIVSANTNTVGSAAPGVGTGYTYPATTTGVFNCWRGNVTADPYINAGNGGPAFSTCSGATAYYAASGITLPGVSGSSASNGTGGGSSGGAPAASGASVGAASNAAAALLAAAAAAALLLRW
jgi:hypothetical protein